MNTKKILKSVFTGFFIAVSSLGGAFLLPLRKLIAFAKSSKLKYLKKSFLSLYLVPLFSVASSFKLLFKKTKITKTKANKKKDFKNDRVLFFILGFVTFYFFIFVPLEIYQWYKELPRPELLSQLTNKSTKILDRKGRLLYEIFVDKDFDPIPLDQIPQNVINATIAVEDSEFYQHYGFRPASILRATKESVTSGELQGGSTITQQLVKNVLLSPERTISRKIKEVVVSVMVESVYEKDQILEMYLNNISYGGTAWGIQSASQKFFGVNASDLNLAQSAFLAGLPSSPSVYSPFSGNKEKAKARQGYVLQRMVELEYITKDQANEAYALDLVFAPQQEFIRAPHFVNFVRAKLKEIYGERLVNIGGLTVTTTLDLDLHDQVQNIVSEEVKNKAHLKFTNGAALVLNAKSSEILSYVGSADFFSKTLDGEVDIITSFRQPGSSIKPLTYALALKNGYTPATIIEDTKVTFNFKGSPPYTPVNYDGKYHGKVTLREALANSYNIPAVKIANKLSADAIVKFGKEMGLLGWEADGTYGISVTLGGKEVRLLDLANVYATFSRKGEYIEPTPFLSIKDVNGYEIYQKPNNPTQVLDESVSYVISNILSDNEARKKAFGSNSNLEIPGHTVAVKTGTTDEKRDNWTFGYTPTYVVGVWVGNNDNSPMHPSLSSGLTGAAPIWNRVMKFLLQESANEAFEMPKSVFEKIDEKCDNKREIFIKGTAPAHLCNLSEKKNKKD